MEDLRERVAVVTGGGGGIGAALARRFAIGGMRVVVSDVDGGAADAVARELRSNGAAAIGVRTDVTKLEEIETLAATALEEFGAVHVLCNNAGVVVGGRVDQLTEQEWRWVLDVDLWGPIHGVRVFLPIIEQQGEGHIVTTSSTSGLGAPPFIGPYAVAKAGVIGLMETVRRELSERSSPVGASVLCPGPVRTPLVDASERLAEGLAERSHSAEGANFREDSGAMLQSTGKDPDEIAAMVVDAIHTDRFWIVTHPEWGDVLRERVEHMFSDGFLTGRPMAPSTDRST